jgi:hypothetical protein
MSARFVSRPWETAISSDDLPLSLGRLEFAESLELGLREFALY